MSGPQSSFFDVLQQDPHVVCMKSEQLTEDENLEELDQDFIRLVDNQGVKNLVVDLGSVRYMTSAAIGKLIALHRRLGRLEGKLILANLQVAVHDILDTAHLLTYFTVTDTVDDGVAALS